MGKSIRTYQREIKRLRELVASAEWYQPTYNGSPSCPYCANQQHWNHAVDCPLPEDLRSEMRKVDGEWVLA